MGTNNLRKQKFKLGHLDCEIVDIIPNERIPAQKIQRQGSSNQVVLPFQWEMHFTDNAEVLKVLLKVRVPAMARLANLEFYGMLVMESSDFPIERVVK